MIAHGPPPQVDVIAYVEEHGDERALDVQQVLQTRRVHRSSPIGHSGGTRKWLDATVLAERCGGRPVVVLRESGAV